MHARVNSSPAGSTKREWNAAAMLSTARQRAAHLAVEHAQACWRRCEHVVFHGAHAREHIALGAARQRSRGAHERIPGPARTSLAYFPKLYPASTVGTRPHAAQS